MQRKVQQVVAQWIRAAQLKVQPKGEVGERAGLCRKPHVPPAGGRGDGWIVEDRRVVKDKPTQHACAKCQQCQGDKNHGASLSHQAPFYYRLVVCHLWSPFTSLSPGSAIATASIATKNDSIPTTAMIYVKWQTSRGRTFRELSTTSHHG